MVSGGAWREEEEEGGEKGEGEMEKKSKEEREGSEWGTKRLRVTSHLLFEFHSGLHGLATTSYKVML